MNRVSKSRARSLLFCAAAAATLSTVLPAGLLQAGPARPKNVTAVQPDRVLDTRSGLGAPTGLVVPGKTLAVAIPAASSVKASTIVLNLTAVDATGSGWVKAWACGEPIPTTSSLNFTPNQPVANLVMLKFAAAGVCFATSQPVHLVADVSGWYTGADDFIGSTPNRLLDTRTKNQPLQAGEERRLKVAGMPGIGGGAAMAGLNLTVDRPADAGWVVAYPCGQSTTGSTVNFQAGEIVANFTVVGLGAGYVCFRSLGTVNLVVDSYGWSAGVGKLAVASPTRLLDTRDAAQWPSGKFVSNSKIELQVAGRGGIPSNADAALITVTVTNTTSNGFITVWPCDQPLPLASTINTWPNALRSNLAFAKLSAVKGTACLQYKASDGTPTDLVVDASGWTTGGPERTIAPGVGTVTPPPTPPAPTTTTTTTTTTTSPNPTPTNPNPTPTTPTPIPPPVTVPSGPGCALAAAAFCETFDAPAGNGGKTGDLNPVLWGVSRVGDVNPPSALNKVAYTSMSGCGSTAFMSAPNDVRICNGQMFETVNDGGGVSSLHTYPKQPFSFTGRTGKVVFDVSADSQGTHAAWPEFFITDKPVPGMRGAISGLVPAGAANSIGFALAGCIGGSSQTGVSAFYMTKNNAYSEPAFTTTGCVTMGSPSAMNHFEVRVNTATIEVWGTDAGSNILKQLAVANNLGLTFSQGLVWMNDVHYNARKGGNHLQWNHTFAWDNLGFDGPKTYRDLGFDTPDANVAGGTTGEGDRTSTLGYHVGTGPVTLTVNGVNRAQTPTGAQVVLNTYSFGAVVPSISVNGGPWIDTPWPYDPGTYSWRALSIPVPLAQVHDGTNTITLRSGHGSTTVANVSIILVAAAPVP